MGRIQLLDQGYGSGADNPPPTFDPGTTPQAPTPTFPAPTEPRTTDPGTGGPTIGTQPVPGGRTTENPNPYQPPATSGASGILSRISQFAAANPNANPSIRNDPNYWATRIMQTHPDGNIDWNYWESRMLQPEGPPEGAGGQHGSYGGTGVFNDPATAAFERLLNQRIGQLQTPYSPPGMQPALDYLNKYFQQLQGPAYTPDQMDLMQTQTLDPLARERDAQRQRIQQNFGARGMTPDSGVVQKALLDSDQNFERLRTGTQAQFATGAIHTQKQQQAQAASLGPQIAAIEQNQFNNQEGRLDQAVNLAHVIPDMAWSRLTGSGNIMQQTNPLGALQLQNSFQQQGYNQGADFSQGLMGILPYLLQIYGGGR